MDYPVTADKMSKSFEEANGCKMPEEQKTFWDGFADLLNGAYNAGVIAGVKKAQEAICKA